MQATLSNLHLPEVWLTLTWSFSSSWWAAATYLAAAGCSCALAVAGAV